MLWAPLSSWGPGTGITGAERWLWGSWGLRELTTLWSLQKSVKEGLLLKQTSSFQRWKRRYFKLRGRTLYYAKDAKVGSGGPSSMLSWGGLSLQAWGGAQNPYLVDWGFGFFPAVPDL